MMSQRPGSLQGSNSSVRSYIPYRAAGCSSRGPVILTCIEANKRFDQT